MQEHPHRSREKQGKPPPPDCGETGRDVQFTFPSRIYNRESVAFEDPIPARGFRGHVEKPISVTAANTVVACMHCMNHGFPGGREWSADSPDSGVMSRIESIPRTKDIIENHIAPVVEAARSIGMRVIYLLGALEKVARKYPQYLEIASRIKEHTAPELPRSPHHFREELDRDIFGDAFLAPAKNSSAVADIAPPIKPQPQDWIATTIRQVTTVLSENGISNIIYTGFATGGCLRHAVGGVDFMAGLGYRCIVLRDCTTDEETAETAPEQLITRCALLSIEQSYGYTADSHDVLSAIHKARGR